MTLNNGLAPTPPMGWNSWDCFGPSVLEDEVKANADYMAAHLLQYGWDTIVVDIQWSDPAARAHGYNSNAELVMDEYGRLLPALNRFPSAANGAGFKPLADYVHNLGLKFGIHILRGIPRLAVKQNLPIFNSKYRAAEVANTNSLSPWIDDMYGLDMSKAGAQDYYNSVIELYETWDVDFIKCDDILFPFHDTEIAGLHKAIEHIKRPIVLSLSPGTRMTTDRYPHLQQNCELFRISDDFWDRWIDLKEQFANCAKWATSTGPGCWADADMLPLGHIGIRAERGDDRQSLLTHDEQVTLMTLWVIAQSPLMFGGHLPDNDDFTLELITNDDVLNVLKVKRGSVDIYQKADLRTWLVQDANSENYYLALFNIGDQAATIETNLALIGKAARYEARDLWSKSDIGKVEGRFSQDLAPHAAKLYRLSPVS